MLSHGKYSDLTSEQYELLGRAFIEWSNIEFLLGVLLSRLLFTPEFLGRTYSDEMSAVKLESAIRNALDIHAGRYSETVITSEINHKIKKIIIGARSCRVLRNKFAHYVWMRRNNNEIFGAKMSGKLLKQKKESESLVISIEELKENYQSAYALVEELKSVISEIPKIEEEQNLKIKSSRPPSSSTG